jgi:hypothetical protein
LGFQAKKTWTWWSRDATRWPTGQKGRLKNASALLPLREQILTHLADPATESRFPLTPQRIVHDVRQVMPEDGIAYGMIRWKQAVDSFAD